MSVGKDSNTPETVDSDESEEDFEESELSHIDLPSGRALSLDAAQALFKSVPTNLLVIAGPADCGKTTLVTSIYEHFQWGDLGDFRFHSSETLMGFEQRCFLSRVISGRDEQDTRRTPIGESTFLHLRVQKADNSETSRNLVITDLAGETFKQARDSAEDCRSLVFLPRADHLIFLIDGKKLANRGTRWSAAQDSISLLQMMLDNDMLSKDVHVTLLFSKWDHIAKSHDLPIIDGIVKTIEDNFTQRFKNRILFFKFAKIAARPEKSALPFGYGLPDLFKYWTSNNSYSSDPNMNTTATGNRQSEFFLKRQLSQ